MLIFRFIVRFRLVSKDLSGVEAVAVVNSEGGLDAVGTVGHLIELNCFKPLNCRRLNLMFVKTFKVVQVPQLTRL